MRKLEYTCPCCGAPVQGISGKVKYTCEYCDSEFYDESAMDRQGTAEPRETAEKQSAQTAPAVPAEQQLPDADTWAKEQTDRDRKEWRRILIGWLIAIAVFGFVLQFTDLAAMLILFGPVYLITCRARFQYYGGLTDPTAREKAVRKVRFWHRYMMGYTLLITLLFVPESAGDPAVWVLLLGGIAAFFLKPKKQLRKRNA